MSARAHLPIRPDWLASYEEPVLDPAVPVIDPHHHLWDHAGAPYLLPDLLADLGSGHNVQATMYVECGARYREGGDPALRSLGETEFATAAAREAAALGQSGVVAGIVGNVDLRLGARAQPVLEAHLTASDGRLRSIRNISAYHADPAARGSLADPPPMLLADAAFRAGFAELEPLGLRFDAHLYHSQHDELTDLARTFPRTQVVINHCGSPLAIGPYAGQREQVFRDWRASLARLAQCKNVATKVGGFGMRMFGFGFEDRPEPAPSDDLAAAWRPYALACIELFGPERCMLESNFPVDKAVCSYRTMWNALKRIGAEFSTSERAALLGETARRIYGL